MGRCRRYLESITRLQRPGRLTLYRKLKAAFKDIGGLNPWMRVAPDCHSRFYFRLYKQRYVSGRRTVRLRQNLSCDARSSCGGRGLCRGLSGNELGEPTNRAACNTCKISSGQHGDLLPSQSTNVRG